MYIIQTIEFRRLATFPKSKNLILRGDRLSLKDGETVGGIVTPAFDPRLAYQYEGFEICPEQPGVTIAVIKVGKGYYADQNGAWSPVSEPVFYTPDQLRRVLERWAGPIQFQLKVERSTQGRSPQIEALKFAYHAPGNIIDYCLEFAIPRLLSVPIDFSYPVETSGNRLTVPLPPGFVPERLESIQVYVPGHRPQAGTVTGSGDSRMISVGQPLEAGTPRLLFGYAPAVIYVSEDDLYQISEVPTILLRVLPGMNYRQHQVSDSIRLAGGKTRYWEAKFNYDQPFELRIVANDTIEARRIGERVLGLVKDAGMVSALPYEIDVPIQTLGSIVQGNYDKLSSANLQLLSLKMVLLQQIQGETYHDEDTLTGIAPTPVPVV